MGCDGNPGVILAGRPTDYKPEYCHTIVASEKIAGEGATDVAIAQELGVDRRSVIRWREQHPAFAEACAAIKQMADDQMEASLFRRGLGYSHDAVKIFQYEGRPVTVDYTEHYPPETAAASLWLRNRRPDKWRERIEHTGADGGPIVIATALEEARRRAAVDVPFEEVKQIAAPAEEPKKPSIADALKATRKP